MSSILSVERDRISYSLCDHTINATKRIAGSRDLFEFHNSLSILVKYINIVKVLAQGCAELR